MERKFYKIYDYQAKVLRQMTMVDGMGYNPVVDTDGDYFITEKEHKNSGLGIESEYIAPSRNQELE